MSTYIRFLFAIVLLSLAAGCGTAAPAILPAETDLSPSVEASPTARPAATHAQPSPAVKHPTPMLSGPYLGETLPGAETQVFGGKVLTGGYHSSPTFAPDGSEVYWAGKFTSAKIYFMKSIGGNWISQETLQLPGMRTLRDPFLSPDGSKLFFLSEDRIPASATSGKENIWMVERDGGQWGTPQPLPGVVNGMNLHWTISVADNGNLYFSSGDNGIGDIYVSAYVNGEYTRPVLLDSPVNTPDQIEVTPNIAPDESYILFSRLRDNSSTPHLYISYATVDGWTEPGLVENVSSCISPIVTPDRSYVICLSGPTALIWRDTAFIDGLRP